MTAPFSFGRRSVRRRNLAFGDLRSRSGGCAPGAVEKVAQFWTLLEGSRLAFGLGLGIVAALALTRLMSSLLFGVQSRDPMTLIAAAGGLALVALRYE
jgi:hypothetical protein